MLNKEWDLKKVPFQSTNEYCCVKNGRLKYIDVMSFPQHAPATQRRHGQLYEQLNPNDSIQSYFISSHDDQYVKIFYIN